MSNVNAEQLLARPSQPSLRRIMVTTDFSQHSRKAYAFAARLAKQFKAKIHLVHFGSKKAQEYSGITNVSHLKGLKNSLAKEVKHAAFADLEIETCVLERRDVGRSLSEYQENAGCDLIVTHTLSHQGFHRHFDHQLAEKIVACSTVPVLLFGPAAIDSGIDEPKSVLVPFDFSDKAAAAFPALRLLATQYRSSIKFLFVQTIRCQWLYRLTGISTHKLETFEQRFKQLINDELPNLDVELEFVQGIPEYELCNRVSGSNVDLIVIGTYGKLGNFTKSIIRQAKCPVLAVPTDREKETNLGWQMAIQ